MKYLKIIVLLVAFASCKKDPPCEPSVDPCEGVTEVTAEFKTFENKHPNTRVETYIAITSTYLEFRPILDNAETYTWIIESDTNFYVCTAPTFIDHQFIYIDTVYTKELNLSTVGLSTQVGDTLKVTLIVTKNNTNCLPNDDGIDTITKIITFIDDCTPIWEGKWQGYLEGTNPITDTFTVELNSWDAQAPPCGNASISNLDNDACTENYLTSDSRSSARKLWFENYSVICPLFRGTATVEPNNQTIKIDYYSSYDFHQTSIHRVFIGTKIN